MFNMSKYLECMDYSLESFTYSLALGLGNGASIF